MSLGKNSWKRSGPFGKSQVKDSYRTSGEGWCVYVLLGEGVGLLGEDLPFRSSLLSRYCVLPFGWGGEGVHRYQRPSERGLSFLPSTEVDLRKGSGRTWSDTRGCHSCVLNPTPRGVSRRTTQLVLHKLRHPKGQ